MTRDDLLKKLGLDRMNVAPEDVEIVDFSQMSTAEILKRIRELRERLSCLRDETIEDVEAMMELRALEEELRRRLERGEVVLKLEESIPVLLSKARIRLLSELARRGETTVSDLAKSQERQLPA